MQYTANYSLAKPEENDAANVAVLNGNADKVDTELKNLSTQKASRSELTDHSADATKHVGSLTKEAPIDTDSVALIDSADGSKLKRLSWTSIKSTLGLVFASLSHTHAWSSITEKPNAFTPNAHKSNHVTGGSDELSPSDIGAAAKSTSVNYTMAASGWAGSSAPYTQTFSNTAITATCPIELVKGDSMTTVQLEMLQFANIQGGAQAAGSIVLQAYGEKPTANLPVRFIIRGDL